MPSEPTRLAVFVSGTGRSLANLIERQHDLPASIVLVASDRACKGLEIARDAGISTLQHRGTLRSDELEALCADHRIELIALAGYLRKMPVPEGLEGRIVNIHPALLPRFGGAGMYGERVHRAVLEAARTEGVRESGCTVHLCDDRYDTGPIVLQRRCPIEPDDTPDSLAARVFEQELAAYPEALASIIGSLRGA